RHAQITARTQEASLEDLVKRTKSAYEAKLELSVKRPLNDTLRDQMLAAFDQNKAAEKLLTRTKSRSQGLRSEQAWVETLRSRIQAAQHPPPMPSGPAQRAVRHGEQRMSPVQEDEQGEASRALGKAMGRRAARRYWGVGVYLAYRVKADRAQALADQSHEDPASSSTCAEELRKLQGELPALKRAVKSDPVANDLDWEQYELEYKIEPLLGQEIRTSLASAEAAAASASSVLSKAQKVYRDAQGRAEGRSWDPMARAQAKARLLKLNQAQKERDEANGSVDDLHFRLQAAQDPLSFLPTRDTSHPSTTVRQGKRRAAGRAVRVMPQVEEEAAERALGKRMGLRAARRYWGVGYE
ncbi:hypothetical protein JCM6882_008657, partial [Rhodosporidiobolus microsporus]